MDFEKMVYVKIHRGTREVVAICDCDLIGKIFFEGDMQLKISEDFYKGEDKPDEEVKDIIRNSNNLNIVGKRSINLALGLRMINKNSIIVIGGVPHAQILSL